MYIRDQIDNNKFSFSRSHHGEEQSEVIFGWIKTYYDYLPKSILPEKTELRGFSNYFTSFLTTSFNLVEVPEITDIRSGCYCDICLQFANVSHLKSIAPLKYDRRIAKDKRVEMVLELAHFYKVHLSEKRATEIANSKWTIKQVAYLTYTKALFQRIQFGEGGVYILALWRQFAWNERGAPIRDFNLKVEEVLKAERRIKGEIFK